MISDPYRVLGVSKDASPEEIKKAYRTMAKKYHPDLHPDDPAAAEKMNEINEAYDMISNPDKYRNTQYGGYGAGSSSSSGGQSYGYGQQSGGYGGYNDPFSDFFRQYGQQSSGSRQSQGSGYYDFNFDDIFGFGGRSSAYRTSAPKSPVSMADDSQEIKEAVDFINMGQYSYAAASLNRVSSACRDARWCYLYALTNYGLGNTVLAMDQIKRAMELDPNSGDYRDAYDAMAATASSYSTNGSPYRSYSLGIGRIFLWLCLSQFLCMFCRFF